KLLKHIDITQTDDISRPQTDGWAFPRIVAAHPIKPVTLKPGEDPPIQFPPVAVKPATVNRPGIYSVDGDRLRICVTATGATRPTAFVSKEGEDAFWLWEFKRVTPPAQGGK